MSPLKRTHIHTNTNLMLLSQYVPALTTQTLWLPTHTHTPHTYTHRLQFSPQGRDVLWCFRGSGQSRVCVCACVRACAWQLFVCMSMCPCVCWRGALIWQSPSSSWSPVQLIWLDVDPTGLVSSNMLPVSSCSPASSEWTHTRTHTHHIKRGTHLF